MRKTAALLAAFLLLLGPASRAAAEDVADIVISENNFVYQLNLLTAYPATYAGQTVEIEGLFGIFHYGEEDDLQPYYEVYRYVPGGCCAADALGLEVSLPDTDAAYPADGTWVRARGVLETYELDGVTYPQARLTELTETAEVGDPLVLP